MAIEVGKRGAFADINVVPLIDILLVLLVIFMIIPHKQTGLDTQIPQPAPLGDTRVEPEVIVVQVRADNSLRVNQEPVTWEDLRPRLEQIFKGRAHRVAFVRGDGQVEFQVVARVIDIMVAAGVTSVDLMTRGLENSSAIQ